MGSPAMASVRRGAGPFADTSTMPCCRTNDMAASAFIAANPQSPCQRGPGQSSDGTQCGLRRVQSEAKVSVGVGRIDIRRLMPLWIPPGADLASPFVFAQADCGHDVHEWCAIRIGHVRSDACRAIGRVGFVRGVERPPAFLPPAAPLADQLKSTL